jgi:Acyltransferase family
MDRPGRLHWLDWLKALVVLGVFGYHSAVLFAYAPWLLVNRERSLVLSALAGFGYTFGMPLMFTLAGAGAWFGLRSRGPGHFLRERLFRLAIPFAFGVVLLSPFQAFIAASARGPVPGGLLGTYVSFLRGIRFFLNPQWMGIYGYHLWFLGFLFAYSVIALPVFVGLARSPRVRAAIGRLGDRPSLMLLFAIPIAITQMALGGRYPGYENWADFTYWLTFYIAGYAIAGDRRLLAALPRCGGVAVLTGVSAGVALGLLLLAGLVMAWAMEPSYRPWFLLFQAVRSLDTWAWVLAVMWIGTRYLDFASSFTAYWDEALMPFYVLHHPVVVAVGFFVIQLTGGVWFKFGLVVVLALSITLGIYELLVKRIPLLRVLSGMRPVPPESHRPAVVARPA